jgi:hypothetical protein
VKATAVKALKEWLALARFYSQRQYFNVNVMFEEINKA